MSISQHIQSINLERRTKCVSISQELFNRVYSNNVDKLYNAHVPTVCGYEKKKKQSQQQQKLPPRSSSIQSSLSLSLSITTLVKVLLLHRERDKGQEQYRHRKEKSRQKEKMEKSVRVLSLGSEVERNGTHGELTCRV